MALLSLEQVSKRHRSGRRGVVVLEAVSLEVDQNDYVGIWGAPRSGKSSLLRLAAGIEEPDAGRVCFDGRDLARLSSRERALVLRRSIGFVAPPFDQAGSWSASRAEGIVDHVAIPLIADGVERRAAVTAARSWLERVDAIACAHATTSELSPGERMRVALARALVREPRLLLVDEPGLAPSPQERDSIRDLLRGIGRESDTAVVVASEDVAMLRGASRMLSVGSGRLLSTDRLATVVRFPHERAARSESSR
ncbi:MAG TPA: ATP-binding cassette domain-containing protein [Thermoleophilaceae bacterium]